MFKTYYFGIARRFKFVSKKRLINSISNYSSDSGAISPVALSFNHYDTSAKKTNLEPIVIIHGLLGSKQNWSSMAKRISQDTGRRVFCVDARNHGNSPHTDEMSYAHMAADISLFIEEHVKEPPVLMGHSMGGRAATYLALQQPSAISRLAVLDISPIRSSPSLGTMGSFFKILRKIRIKPGTPISRARTLADQQMSSVIKDASIRLFLLMNLEGVNRDNSVQWRANMDALEQNFETQIALPCIPENSTFGKPTLLVAGSRSDYVLPSEEEELRKLFPKLTFSVIEAGHWIHAENPDAFLKTLIAFLNSTS